MNINSDKVQVQGLTPIQPQVMSDIASYAAIFSVAPPLSRELGSDTKNGCVGGYARPRPERHNGSELVVTVQYKV